MATSPRLASRFAVVGAGKMAEAMVGGMMASSLQPAANVNVYDTNVERMDVFRTKFGVNAHADVASCVENADLVLISVKPQHMDSVLTRLRPVMSPSALAVSIAAGCPISMFTENLPTSSVVRSMPNTPAMVGQGCTVWTATPACTDDQLHQAKSLLSCFGDEHQYTAQRPERTCPDPQQHTHHHTHPGLHVLPPCHALFGALMECVARAPCARSVADEAYLDMATALVGSGPAFTFLFMEAMVDTGVHMGFPRETARALVQKTVEGSAALARANPGTHIAQLRNDITSPGGTTAAAIYSSDRGGFRTTVADAIWAAYRRSLELGGKSSMVGPDRSKH
jgi:pyrroline-5-carboxylate reductase